MEVSGQLHAPAALHPGKEPSLSIRSEAGWTPEPVWMLGSREIILGPVKNQTPAVQAEVRRYTN
jgi:hypothetical protein